MLKTINNYKDMTYFKGVCNLVKDRLVSLGFPLFIGLLFNIPYLVLQTLIFGGIIVFGIFMVCSQYVNSFNFLLYL